MVHKDVNLFADCISSVEKHTWEKSEYKEVYKY